MINWIKEVLGFDMNKKFWIVYSPSEKVEDTSLYYVTYVGYHSGYNKYNPAYYSESFFDKTEAEKHAKQLAFKNLGRNYTVLEALESTIPPIPEVQFEQLEVK